MNTGSKQAKPGLWEIIKDVFTNRNLLLICGMMCASAASTAVSKVYVNQYGTELGISVALLGIITTIQGVCKVVARPLSGRAMDIFDIRKWVVVIIALKIATYLLYGIFPAAWAFTIARLLEGVTFVLLMTANYTLQGLAVDRRILATSMSVLALISMPFTLVFTALAPYAYSFNSRLPFFLSAALLLLQIACAMLLKFPEHSSEAIRARKERAKAEGKKESFKLSNYIAPKGLAFMPMAVCNTAFIAFNDLLIAIYATELGYMEAAAAYVAASSLFGSYTGIVIALIADKFGDQYAAYVGFLARGVSYVLLAFFPSPLIFTVAGALNGFGGTLKNPMQAQAIRIFPKAKMGVATSTHLLLSDIGVMVMSAVCGIIVAALGYTQCFILCIALSVVGMVSYGLLNPVFVKWEKEADEVDRIMEEKEHE